MEAANFDKLVVSRFEVLNYGVVIFRVVGEGAICAVFDFSSIFFYVVGISCTVFSQIQRTVTEQAVKILQSFVAGEILTVFVLKKAM